MLQLAEEDERVVAGAAVGSLADGSGDKFSDLDLTFGIAVDVPVADVLDDWTRTLAEELDAAQLADLQAGPTIYRVFLLPDALQFDLSMTPATEFRPAGPRFQLLFGETAADEPEAPRRSPGGLFIPTPAVAGDIFGWGVIYALHARACIERGRVWQAEHYVERGTRSRPLARVPQPRSTGRAGARLRPALRPRPSRPSTAPTSGRSSPRHYAVRSARLSPPSSTRVRKRTSGT